MRLFFGIPVSEEVRAFYLETLKPQLEAEFIGKFVETENCTSPCYSWGS